MKITIKEFLIEAANDDNASIPRCNVEIDNYAWTDLLVMNFDRLESWEKMYLGALIFDTSDKAFETGFRYLVARYGFTDKLLKLMNELTDPYPSKDLDHCMEFRSLNDPEMIAKEYPCLADPDKYMLITGVKEIGHYWINDIETKKYIDHYNLEKPYLIRA